MTDSVFERIIVLLIYPTMTEAGIQHIVAVITPPSHVTGEDTSEVKAWV